MIDVLQVEAELEVLCDLYEEVRPATVLEIGTYQGGTLREWLMRGDPHMVVAVDTHHVNPDLYEKWRQENTYLHVIEGNSTDSNVRAQISEFSPYDWVFIDGDHAEAGVLADTQFVFPLIRAGGYLVYHDIIGDVRQPIYAPGLIVDEFEMKGHEVTRFIDGGVGEAAHGIGVVKIK